MFSWGGGACLARTREAEVGGSLRPARAVTQRKPSLKQKNKFQFCKIKILYAIMWMYPIPSKVNLNRQMGRFTPRCWGRLLRSKLCCNTEQEFASKTVTTKSSHSNPPSREGTCPQGWLQNPRVEEGQALFPAVLWPHIHHNPYMDRKKISNICFLKAKERQLDIFSTKQPP